MRTEQDFAANAELVQLRSDLNHFRAYLCALGHALRRTARVHSPEEFRRQVLMLADLLDAQARDKAWDAAAFLKGDE